MEMLDALLGQFLRRSLCRLFSFTLMLHAFGRQPFDLLLPIIILNRARCPQVTKLSIEKEKKYLRGSSDILSIRFFFLSFLVIPTLFSESTSRFRFWYAILRSMHSCRVGCILVNRQIKTLYSIKQKVSVIGFLQSVSCSRVGEKTSDLALSCLDHALTASNPTQTRG
ncbi:hypothetical protein DFP73DRAFT_251851 [Morchella snyderi]|nr:hypothetical protein DFP73DRAFT_251851 [Morchella snyderi]